MDQRLLVPELMDDPELEVDEHQQALAGLRRINFFSRTSARIAKTIERFSQSRNIRVLDLACGGGDVTLGVANRLKQIGIKTEIVGRDISPTAIAYANRQAAHAGLNACVRFEIADAIQGLSESDDSFDFIFCSLFLHHLTHETSVELLRAMKRRATQGIIVDDLLRDPFGYLLAQFGCRILSRSKIVHFDGPQSVKAAYTKEEILAIADQSGLDFHQITMHWPKRFCLVWLCNESAVH